MSMQRSLWQVNGMSQEEMAHKGKNQSLNSAINTARQNRQGKDKGQGEIATLLLL